MKYLLLFLSVLALCSCKDTEIPHDDRITKFTSEMIYIGMPKNLVIQAFGEPLSRDSYSEDSKRIDILCYKEIVDVGDYPYILTTTLYFNNNILGRIEQSSERTRSSPTS